MECAEEGLADPDQSVRGLILQRHTWSHPGVDEQDIAPDRGGRKPLEPLPRLCRPGQELRITAVAEPKVVGFA